MPELPEVQTIVNQLDEILRGLKIETVEVLNKNSFHGNVDQVIGAEIAKVYRRAKIILLQLDNNKTIAVHLKMTGQLIFGEIKNKNEEIKISDQNSKNKKKTTNDDLRTNDFVADTVSFIQGIASFGFSLPNKSTKIVFHLSNNRKLFFNDMRKFGWVKVLNSEELRNINEKHGPEPFDSAQGRPSNEFTLGYFIKIVSSWNRSIKLLLMDQEKIAGIGNIYANEALWYSKINPQKSGKQLALEDSKYGLRSGKSRKGKIESLYENLIMVLSMGIKYQGASDNTYVDAMGGKGSMQEHFMVYGKQGTPCQRCGEKIVRIEVGGRGTFYCPVCQR